MQAEAIVAGVLGGLTMGVGALAWLFQIKGRVDTLERQREDDKEDLRYIRGRVDEIWTKLVLVAALLLAGVGPAAAQDWSTIVPKASKAVLRVEVTDGVGVGSCSAVVINRQTGHVITAGHCVPSDKDTRSFTVDGRDATVVAHNTLLDLAVLKTKLRMGVVALAIAEDQPPTGTAIAVVGFPFGAREVTVQTGIVANAREARTGMTWVNADLLPGDSGGAIISAQGTLVAMTSGFVYNGAAHMGLAVSLETIRDFAEDYLPTVVK